jgi:hypothetical protein
MSFLLSIGQDARRLDAEDRARLVELVQDRAPLGLEPAALSVGEPLGRQLEVGKVGERAPRALETLVELRGEPATR